MWRRVYKDRRCDVSVPGGGVERLSVDNLKRLFVAPLHPNPVVHEAIPEGVRSAPNVLIVEPLSYSNFVHLLDRSTAVLTDSGGIQQEAVSLGLPVGLLRSNTERPEGVDAGYVRIMGTSVDTIMSGVEAMLRTPRLSPQANPFGQGEDDEKPISVIVALFKVLPSESK